MNLYLPPLALSQFQLLSPRAQLLLIVLEGIFLACRREKKASISLYFLADGARGFFSKVGLDEAQGCFVVLRSFGSSVPLMEYVVNIALPESTSRKQ
jgi:hypothetical protein